MSAIAFSESEIQREQEHARIDERAHLSYYGIPFLKRPTWKWHIAWYFFLEGVSGAGFALGSLAGIAGGRQFERLRRSAHEISFLALLPCPALLIWDLGRPARFHHMLRVWKPKSPMNLGAWALSAFSGFEAIAFAQAAGDDHRLGPFSGIAAKLPATLAEIAGLPLSLFMTSYTGVLLSGTSTPVWNQTPLLGAAFSASSFASTVDAMQLEYSLRDVDDPAEERALRSIGIGATAAETALIIAHVKRSGRAGSPLATGLRGLQLWGGLALSYAALVLPMLQRRNQPGPKLLKSGKWTEQRKGKLIAALLGLAGAFLIRWAFVHAGEDAADDVEASHAATSRTSSAPGW